eukprot:g54933.t1
MTTFPNRTLVYMAAVAIDYKLTWLRYPLPEGQPEFYYVLGERAVNFDQEDLLVRSFIMHHRAGLTVEQIRDEFEQNAELREFLRQTTAVHTRSANRLLKLLTVTKGLYIKIGQAISAMESHLPKEYVQCLAVLQDMAPASSFASVQRTFLQDFGQPLSTFFREFEEEPIAAASVAQVHRAVLHSGEQVAVKVQHQPLRRQFQADMLAQWLVMTIADALFEAFDLAWMHPELRSNLEKELDFENEGRNGDRCAALFAENKTIVVPRVYWQLTSPRVLTMEFMHGVKITQQEELQKMGISARQVGAVAMSSLTEQIFLHGFVHCDPHPGNILVRPLDATGRPITPQQAMQQPTEAFQLVLLDHGLYRELREDVRLNYCKLWRALVLRDYKECEFYSRQLGVENWEMFAMMVLMRPYVVDGNWYRPLMNSTSFKEVKEMRKRHVGPQAKARKAFFEVMKEMPEELLLVFRNQNYLRGLNKMLGQPVNRFTSFARTAVRGISRHNISRQDLEEVAVGTQGGLFSGEGQVDWNAARGGWLHVEQVQQSPLQLAWDSLTFEVFLNGYDWGYWLALKPGWLAEHVDSGLYMTQPSWMAAEQLCKTPHDVAALVGAPTEWVPGNQTRRNSRMEDSVIVSL